MLVSQHEAQSHTCEHLRGHGETEYKIPVTQAKKLTFSCNILVNIGHSNIHK